MASNQSELTLYHHPGSFYSMKARVGFAEKGLAYNSHIVDLETLEMYAPYYMKMNPSGQVPFLQTGDKVIPDSKEIIRYLDNTYPETPRLIPTDDSARSRKVLEFNRRLDDIKIDVITYGAGWHEDLTHQPQLPFFFRRYMKRMAKGDREKCVHDLADKYPEYKEIYEKRIKPIQVRDERIKDRAYVLAEVEKLEAIFTDVEKYLEQNKGNEKYIGGENFTIADITLALTMIRMKFVGFSFKCWEGHKRPLLDKYYNLYVLNRPSVMNESTGAMKRFIKSFIMRKLVKYGAGLVTVVALLGIGVTLWRSYKES